MNAIWQGMPIIDALASMAPGADRFEVKMPRELLRDEESLAEWPNSTVAKYLFGPSSERTQKATNPAELMAEHTQWGIAQSQFLVDPADAARAMDLVAPFGDHFFASVKVDPHRGVRGTREMERALRANPGIKSCSVSPFSLYPPIPINSKEFYVVYAKAEELGIPILVNVGIPGPRVPGLTQDPSLLDEICWFFPDLKIVMKHGGEPWEDMCVKLMLKWPNLYYMTSAFTPKWYPKAIVRYMNTRGKDKVMFAGYWPLIAYERVFAQFNDLQLRDDVWEKFLHRNAAKVFGLSDGVGRDANGDDDR